MLLDFSLPRQPILPVLIVGDFWGGLDKLGTS